MANEEVPGVVPPSINCHQCNTLIDLAGQTAFTHVDCTQCGALSVVPLQFGNFLLLNPLGVGGMGTVYKAIDLALNRFLALKILRKKLAAKPEFIENFSREARAAAAVNHPNIAQVYSFGEHDNQYYLAMELLERGSLDDRISTLGKITEKDVLSIGQQVAAGLRAAEQRGLLHRDIKPGNILFNDDNVPKIVDFGLARASNESRAANEPIWGTPYYIAPEKLRGQPEDVRSDIYSLGATLFHALAGRPPFEAATATEVVTKHATQPAQSLKTYAPDIQPSTAHAIGRMLAKTPAERYQNYDELLHELNEAIAQYKLSQTQRTVVAAGGERIPITSVIGSIVALVAAGVVIWYAWGHLNTTPPPNPGSTNTNSITPILGTGPTTVGTPSSTEPVNFQEESPWVKAWNSATLELTQGHYQDALAAYDSAKRLAGPSQAKVRQWVQLFEGLTLLAADRPGMSVSSFSKGIDPGAPRGIPSEITTGNLVDSLLLLMLEGLPIAEVEQAIPRMPPWAAALTQVCIGFKHLEDGRLQAAAESFRRYIAIPRAGPEAWAFSLQPLADRLARECDQGLAVLREIDRLQAAGKAEEADAALRKTLVETRSSMIRPVLEARGKGLQADLAKIAAERERAKAEAERLRQQQAAKERERAEEETRFVQAIDPQITPFIARYDFQGAREKYREVSESVTTELGRKFLQTRLDVVEVLINFKKQLGADIARQPYPGNNLRTRENVALMGDLSSATDTELFFATKYGQLVHAWPEFAPAELIKLGGYYAEAFSATEEPTAHARRYLSLAVFAKQYNQDKAVEAYSQKALQLQPELADEVNRLLGK